jgi:DNA-binding response OmpR family regulator
MDIWCGGASRSSLLDMDTALLLAEAEPEARVYLERHLSLDGFRVIEAGWDAQALDLAERSRPDVVLTGASELCARLREGEPGRHWDCNVPVIVLTAPDADVVDRVRAFERGADDVVGRHLYLELVARIHALLRRSTVGVAEVIEVGDLVVDHRSRQVRLFGAPVPLAAKEFDLAARLATDPERVFTRDELLRDVWGLRTRMVTRTVDSHASRLRRKLRAAGDDRYVVNVWGKGYRLLDRPPDVARG